MNYKLSTVITQEGKWYIARCLELHVSSQGKTIEQAQKNLKEAVELYLDDTPSTMKKHLPKTAPLFSTLEIQNV